MLSVVLICMRMRDRFDITCQVRKEIRIMRYSGRTREARSPLDAKLLARFREFAY
jgi:hypothetical protein